MPSLPCFSPLLLFFQVIYWLFTRRHYFSLHMWGICWVPACFGWFTFFISFLSFFFLSPSSLSSLFTTLFQSHTALVQHLGFSLGLIRNVKNIRLHCFGSRLYLWFRFVSYCVCGSRLYMFLSLSAQVGDFVSYSVCCSRMYIVWVCSLRPKK